MSTPELALLIIEEETDSISSRRITKLESIFSQLNIDCISSQNQESTIKLFNENMNIKPNYIIISIGINSLDEILKKINELYEEAAIILLYSIYSIETLPMVKLDYSIKYDLERNEINLENIELLTFKIKSDSVFKKNFQRFGSDLYARIVLDSTKNERHIVHKNFRCIILLDQSVYVQEFPLLLIYITITNYHVKWLLKRCI